MTSQKKFALESTPFTNHPAYVAWSTLNSKSKRPSAIETLTKKDGKPLNKNVLIHRLSGVGINGSSVIAKKTSLDQLTYEKILYEEFLPLLPLNYLHFYGFIANGDSETAWIFLEEAQGKRYSERNEEDRILIAKWLGVFHASSSQIGGDSHLKQHGAERYYEELNSGYIALSTNLLNSYTDNASAAVLHKILLNFDVIESNWAVIMRRCDQMPRCLVHGDLHKGNMAVNFNNGEQRIDAFDWELAGWGVPAIDLRVFGLTFGDGNGLELISYQKAIQEYWPGVDKMTIKEWNYLGLIFRYLIWISKISKSLAPDWFEKPINDLNHYNAELSEVLKKLDWI